MAKNLTLRGGTFSRARRYPRGKASRLGVSAKARGEYAGGQRRHGAHVRDHLPIEVHGDPARDRELGCALAIA